MDLFAASSIITFFASIGFGLFIYVKDTKSKLGQAWLLSSATIAIWALSLYGVTSSQDAKTAMYWQYVLDFFAILIPVFYFIFISVFLNLDNKKLRYIFGSVGILLAFFSITTLFKTGVSIKFGFYWVDPGKFYIISPVFFLGLTVYTIYLLFKTYSKLSEDKSSKDRIKYQIFASVVGFGGGATNFFPQFFDAFPFGNYFVILYVFFMSYSVLRHQSFGTVKAIAAELITAALALVFLFNFLISPPLINQLFFRLFVFILVVFFAILLIRGVRKEVETRERVEKLVGEIEMANKKLRKMEKQKMEFVSIASHQLRTPLTAIKGYASMLLEGSFGKLTEGVMDAVDKIFKSSQVLVVIIEDFLMVSRIEQGRVKYDFTVVSLRDTVKEVVRDIEEKAKEKNLAIHVYAEDAGSFNVSADHAKIKQVIYNVINNAILYTEKGFIKILFSKNQENNMLRVAVSDTGVGIDKDMMSKLFKKFSKGKENNLGSGIGLYVAKEIVKAHRGRIWAQSDGKMQGSTFFIELPEMKKHIEHKP
jgi:signal transduction histidine kinase